MIDLSTREMKVARQYLSPNVRLEVDSHLLTGLPLSEPLVRLLREVLTKNRIHKEAPHDEQEVTSTAV